MKDGFRENPIVEWPHFASAPLHELTPLQMFKDLKHVLPHTLGELPISPRGH